LPWPDMPVADRTHDKGHGRVESRTIKVTGVAAGIGFPRARQAVQVTRRSRRGTTGRWRTETVYAVTDLDHDQISPADLADAIRAHWGIENRLH
ncbi:MAG TPA: ISAs1 family transposase, partial [Jiangellaceae bacterium]|nr:ISAs1 family transposase [Jiangellaceae bacterium]